MRTNDDDGYAMLWGIIIVISIVASMFLSYAEHTKPRTPITAESVGKAAGKTSTNFGKGFIKGAWEVIRGKKD